MITEFFYHYTINPDLENTSSQFFQSQCGNYDPVTNPSGFISGVNLLTQTRRHEYNSTTQSHWAFYANALNSPEGNLGDFLESRIAVPGENLNTFLGDKQRQLVVMRSRIQAAFSIEPYPVNASETGQFLGNINYGPNYASCH